MPSVSQSQQRLMAGCLKNPGKMRNCPKMSKSQLRHFAETKRKGLPEHKTPRVKTKFGRPDKYG